MKKARAFIVLSLVAVAFLGPVVLGRKILSQADVLYFLVPWYECVKPKTFARPSNAMLGDHSMHFYPVRDFVRRQLQAGETPLWNPSILMGTPLLADMVSAVFYPLNAFSYLGDLKRGFGWSALCRLILAGTGMYYFCRLLAVSEIGALLAGLSFMLCSFQVVWLSFPHTNVSVLLPWALIAVEKSFVFHDRRSILFMAIIVALLLLGGHPETVLHVALATGAFLLYRLWQERRTGAPRFSWWPSVGRLVSGALLGLGIAALVVLPFVELSWQSGIWEMRESHSRNSFVNPLSTLLTAVAPDAFGNPARGVTPKDANYNECAAYAGLLPLFLALLAAHRWRDDARVQFFLGAGVFCLMVTYGLWPIFDLATALPLLRITINTRLLLCWQFCVAMLAGISIDFLARSSREGADLIPQRFFLLAGGLILLPAYLWLNPHLEIVDQEASAVFGVVYPIVAGGLALAFLWLLRARIVRPQIWAIAACAFTLCDLFIIGYGYNPMVKRNRVFHCVPRSIHVLQRQPGLFRITALEGLTLLPNTAMVYGLHDVRGYEAPVPARLAKFFTEGLQGFYNGAQYHLTDLTATNLRLLSLANVRYLLSVRYLPIADFHLLRVYDSELKIYENTAAFPRAFIVYDLQKAADAQHALTQIMDEKIDLRTVGIIEDGDSLVQELRAQHAQEEGADTAPCIEQVEIVDYQPQRVSLQVELCRAGVVILTDTYYDGWKVTVDGKAQRLYRADYLFRGVHSEKGRHTMEFVYDPLSYKAGVVVSGLSIGILLLLTLWPAFRRTRAVTSRQNEQENPGGAPAAQAHCTDAASSH